MYANTIENFPPSNKEPVSKKLAGRDRGVKEESMELISEKKMMYPGTSEKY